MRRAQTVPMMNWVQVAGRMAPSYTMTNSMGMSKKCVKVGTCSCRARVSSGVTAPWASASFVRRRRRMK